MFSLRRFIKSVKDAFRGLRVTFKNEQNFRIQILIGLLVIILAFIFPLKVWEVILLIVLMMLVLVMELLNTALEYFTDLLKPRLHHYVYLIKDIMAAAVFLTAAGSAIIGLIIFLPHFIKLFE
jgi:diacylglycerol kinase